MKPLECSLPTPVACEMFAARNKSTTHAKVKSTAGALNRLKFRKHVHVHLKWENGKYHCSIVSDLAISEMESASAGFHERNF